MQNIYCEKVHYKLCEIDSTINPIIVLVNVSTSELNMD